MQREVDLVHHGPRLAGRISAAASNSARGGIHAFRIQIPQRRALGRRRSLQRALGGLLDLAIDFMHQQLQAVAIQHAFGDQPLGKRHDRVARASAARSALVL